VTLGLSAAINSKAVVLRLFLNKSIKAYLKDLNFSADGYVNSLALPLSLHSCFL